MVPFGALRSAENLKVDVHAIGMSVGACSSSESESSERPRFPMMRAGASQGSRTVTEEKENVGGEAPTLTLSPFKPRHVCL